MAMSQVAHCYTSAPAGNGDGILDTQEEPGLKTPAVTEWRYVHLLPLCPTVHWLGRAMA